MASLGDPRENLGLRDLNTYSPEDVMAIVASTLSMYNSFELLVLVLFRFKKRAGLYFWSIFLTSLGVIPYCIGWLIVHFDLSYDWLGMAIDSVGWVLLVSGHSVVLYSRLHLVLNSQSILRSVLGMIVANGIIWHTSITVLLFGSSYSPKQSQQGFNSVFNVLEKVQMTFFCLQEFIISGLYIWKTLDILRTALGGQRRFMWKLFAINVFVVVMDIGLLAVEYKSLFLWEQGIKAVTYSVKLKLEFAVLGQLIEFVQNRGGSGPRDPNGVAFMEIPSSQRDGNNRERSFMEINGGGGAICMEDSSPTSTAISNMQSTQSTSTSSRAKEEAFVTTMIDVESKGEIHRRASVRV